MSKATMPAPTVTRWRVPITDYDGNQCGESDWKYGAGKGGGLPWWTREHLITTDQAEAYANDRAREALDNLEALQAECEKLRKDAERYRRLIELGEDFQWENIIRIDIEDFPSRAAAIDAAMQGRQP